MLNGGAEARGPEYNGAYNVYYVKFEIYGRAALFIVVSGKNQLDTAIHQQGLPELRVPLSRPHIPIPPRLSNQGLYGVMT